MGRETKILLALLGLLAGVFLGLVSMKLFVPRPPAGAGPDVQADVASVEPQDLVAPPDLLPPPPAPAALEPAQAPEMPPPAVEMTPPPSRLAAEAPSGPPRDPFVRPAAFDAATPAGVPDGDLLPPPRDLAPPAATVPPVAPARPLAATTATAAASPATTSFPPALAPPPTSPPSAADEGVHVTRPGESWWSIAEQAYGDGRFYRALFAWNRSLDPRVSLAPGTRLQIPPMGPLKSAWPALLPAD